MYKVFLLGLLAAVPSSTNFTLNAYDFGNGASAPGSSSYQLQASAGSEGGSPSSASYALPAGIRATTTIATPPAPTFANPSNEYNRLKLTLNTSGLPADTTYLIAISTDDFATTRYVQTDQTVGNTADVGNYQSYAAWGGAGGFWILGLDNNTTYKVKIAALQGAATGSNFGPAASAATVAPSLTFAVSTSLTSTPPFAVTFASLPAGQVTAGNATISADITTNARYGGSLLVRSQNAGLSSTHALHTIASATADLASAGNGYGAQISNVSESSGGPMSGSSPFNGAGGNVGGLTASWQELASFAAPVTGGNASLILKAKVLAIDPAATDYADLLTISIAPLF